jgi:hypothetical protein
MSIQGYAGNHFMVDKFVFFGSLHHTVQEQHPAELLSHNYGQVLEISLFGSECLTDLAAKTQ